MTIIEEIKKKLPKDDDLNELSELFKVFGDYTRLKVICALLEHEMCVNDIAEVTQMSQSAISHQLKTLKTADLVKSRREGKTIYYSLSDGHVYSIYQAGYDHIMEEE